LNNLATVSAFTFGVQAFITLFVILDPPGATPIFLSLVKSENRKRQKRLAWEGAFSSLVIIVVFALFGQVILDSLHISINALQGAGGLLLFLISMELLTGKDGGDKNLSDNVNVAMVPLGTPILAGPGAIVTTMLYVQYADSSAAKLSLAAAIVAVHIVIGFTLM
jgi:multiple antibiotic resistance protein